MKTNGTGGAETSKTGLSFEKQTDLAYKIQQDLKNKYQLVAIPIKSKVGAFSVIRISDQTKVGILTKQMGFYDVLAILNKQSQINNINDISNIQNINSKKWKPDEVFFNLEKNTVFIVEKKWQKEAGSVDEKLLGFGNKRRLYQNIFNQSAKEPKVSVQFCALFNRAWWLDGNRGKNEKTYQDYFDTLRMDGIKIFFDNYEYWWFGL